MVITKVREITTGKIIPSKIPLVIGYFGSVHVMHVQLLTKFNNYNILTFKDYPRKVKSQLYSFDERIENLSRFKPENIYVFDIKKKNMKAEEFIQKFLMQIKPSHIFVGTDFKFGSDHQNYQLLNKYFPVQTIQYNSKISTTIISKLLSDHKIENANDLLVQPYYYVSKWIPGDKKGKELGFRTMNLLVDHRMPLGEGSYVARVTMGHSKYRAVAFVGKSKTYKRTQPTIELHVLGKRIQPRILCPTLIRNNIKVEFLKFIRENKQFKSEKTLANAIAKDIKIAKAYFDKNK